MSRYRRHGPRTEGGNVFLECYKHGLLGMPGVIQSADGECGDSGPQTVVARKSRLRLTGAITRSNVRFG